MLQPKIAPVVATIPNISAHEFFSRVPDGVWNLFSSWTDLGDYESLHHVIHKNKQCEAHWLNNLRKYAHRADPLFDVFTSVKSLRFVFVREIDVPRGWELHLLLKDHYGIGKHKSLTNNESFAKVCQDGDLDIVRAMVERTQVTLLCCEEQWCHAIIIPRLQLYGLGRLRESSPRDTQEQAVRGALVSPSSQVLTPRRTAL